MLRGRLFFIGATFLGLAYFALRAPLPAIDPRFIKDDFPEGGAPISFSVFLEAGFARDTAHTLLAGCATNLRAAESQWAPAGDGALARMNAALRSGGTHAVPAPMRALFARGEQARVQTGGLYDPRAGGLAENPSRLAGLTRAATYQGGKFGPSLSVQWDFGPLPLAAALEDCAATLKAGGIGNMMLNFGGTLVTRGKRGTAPWRLGIRNTRAKGANDVTGYLLEDRDEALATRGEDDGVIDPRAAASPQGLRLVGVVAPDAPSAAVAAQALFIAGPGAWPALAGQLAVEALAVDKDGRISVTKGLAERVKYLHGEKPTVLP